MSDFLKAVPSAAGSPYALGAYAIAAILFLLAGAKLRELRSVVSRLELVPAEQRAKTIRDITGSVVPNTVTPEQWLRATRLRWRMLLLAALLVAITAIVIVALTRPSPLTTSMLDTQQKIAAETHAVGQAVGSAQALVVGEVKRSEEHLASALKETSSLALALPSFTIEAVTRPTVLLNGRPHDDEEVDLLNVRTVNNGGAATNTEETCRAIAKFTIWHDDPDGSAAGTGQWFDLRCSLITEFDLAAREFGERVTEGRPEATLDSWYTVKYDDINGNNHRVYLSLEASRLPLGTPRVSVMSPSQLAYKNAQAEQFDWQLDWPCEFRDEPDCVGKILRAIKFSDSAIASETIERQVNECNGPDPPRACTSFLARVAARVAGASELVRGDGQALEDTAMVEFLANDRRWARSSSFGDDVLKELKTRKTLGLVVLFSDFDASNGLCPVLQGGHCSVSVVIPCHPDVHENWCVLTAARTSSNPYRPAPKRYRYEELPAFRRSGAGAGWHSYVRALEPLKQQSLR